MTDGKGFRPHGMRKRHHEQEVGVLVGSTRIFYFIAATSLIAGVVVMFAYDLGTGAIITVIDLAVLGFIYIFFFKSMMKSERLMETGKPARARIVTARYTGTVVNDIYKQYDFTLEVFPEEGEPYEAKTRGLVPIEETASFQPGTMIPVMVDPANPSKADRGYAQTQREVDGRDTGQGRGSASGHPQGFRVGHKHY